MEILKYDAPYPIRVIMGTNDKIRKKASCPGKIAI
jgi:hypothetical protein